MAPLSIREEMMIKPREFSERKSEKNKNKMQKIGFTTAEMKIARALAGNNKTIRQRALKSVKYWLHHYTSDLSVPKEEYLKLWSGLFYSMWMSDKPLIQEECAENISKLLHELPLKNSLIFFQCGLITLMNEWFGIDQLRLDKFMMFVRRLLRQALFVLKNKSNFKRRDISTFGDILSATVLNPSKKDATGLFMHFTEIYMEELAKVSQGNLNPEVVTEFVTPFVKCMSITEDIRRINHIRNNIFSHLIFQSDVGMEYKEKYNIWKKERFQGSINQIQKIELDENIEDSMLEEDDSSQNEDVQTPPENKPLDPRAGRVDVELPQLPFRPKAISKLLLKNKFTTGSTVAARKVMNALSEQFAKLSHGSYPLGVTDLRLPKDKDDMSIRKAVNRLVKFDRKITGSYSKSVKRKSIDEPDIDATTKIDKASKKRRKEGIIEEPPLKKLFKYSKPDGSQPLLTNSGLWFVSDEGPKHKKDKNIKVNKTMKKVSSILDECEVNSNANSGLWQGIKKKAVVASTSTAKSGICDNLNVETDESSKVSAETSSKEDAVSFPKQQQDERLSREVNKICLPTSFESTNVPSEKNVKFNKKLVQIQQFHEYHTQVTKSQTIPFDSNKKPGKSILKKSSVESFSNPFYYPSRRSLNY